MTSWMVCIPVAAASLLESGESGTMPPIIARLHVPLLARHLNYIATVPIVYLFMHQDLGRDPEDSKIALESRN